jgi:adenylylsulfate kinase|tara:strand:- start:2013 stop:2516 length:504 start_codon:yes stop_codon:yes gene_type:complete
MLNYENKIYWFTGLSGSGKTTLGKALKKYFNSEDIACCLIDGDDLRNGISHDLGFSDFDRIENNRRAKEITKILLKNNIVPIVTLISPFELEREKIRKEFSNDIFNLIYLKISLEDCRERDTKGLYKKKLNEFTGIQSKFDIPLAPDLVLDTKNETIQQCLAKIIQL